MAMLVYRRVTGLNLTVFNSYWTAIKPYMIFVFRDSVELFSLVQGGPPTSYKYGYNSTYRSYNPSYPFIRLFIGVITPFIIGRGPPCTFLVHLICASFTSTPVKRAESQQVEVPCWFGASWSQKHLKRW